MSHIKNIEKGVLKEFPFVRKVLEEYDSEKIQELDTQFHEGNIQTIESLIEAINKLNPNRGRQVVVKKVLHCPEPYYRNFDNYSEYFDAGKLKVEIKSEGDSKLFTAFFINLIFHNDDRDTTIHNISLTAFTEDKKTTTIPDMIKSDDSNWEKFDIDEFICRINKNTSKRLSFRCISRDFLVEPEVLIKLILSHTSGDIEVVSSSKFIKAIDDVKWAEGSSGGSCALTNPCPYPSQPLPGFGNIDGEIPKM